MTCGGTAASPPPAERVLVIKLGALGDFVQAFGPFQGVRRTWPGAQITLLTTEPYAALARRSGWFDRVECDERPKLWQAMRLARLRHRLAAGRYDLVVDLQTSDRSNAYFRLMKPPRPLWSGIAAGCSHPHANPGRDAMHTQERQAEQLAALGVEPAANPDLDWFDADISRFAELRAPFMLLMPGGAPHRPEKRWPAARFADLAARAADAGLQPVVLGTAAEAAAAAEISARCLAALSLVGRTDLFDVAGLARRAQATVGNDTGPMHIAAAVGGPCVALFSQASDPALCGQRGRDVCILREAKLAEMPVARVAAAAGLA